MGETIGPDAYFMQDKHLNEKSDHVLAATMGGVNRVAAPQNTTLQSIKSGDYSQPHRYAGPSGVIGGSCLLCGQTSATRIHYFPIEEPKPWPTGKLRVQAIKDDNMIRIEVTNPPTNEAERILMTTLPAVLTKFLEKNKDYGDGDEMRCLGAKAEFVRLWNKAAKLKRAIWDGEPLSGEQPDEIMGDMIGHILLALNRASE